MIRWLLASLTLSFSTAAYADVKTSCDGKYAQTAEVIDRAFLRNGKLYSGGDGYWAWGRNFYFHRLGKLDATVNAYRVMVGLEPLEGLSSPNYRGGLDYYQFQNLPLEDQMAEVKAALTMMTEPSPEMTSEEMIRASIILDVALKLGPVRDWWLRPVSETANMEIYGKYFKVTGKGLTPIQKEVRKLAQTSAPLDWLQSNLATARIPASWATKADPDMPNDQATVMRHVETKAAAGDGLNPYAALLYPSEVRARAYDRAKIKAGITAVKACTATTADYAVLAGGSHFLGDEFMPTARLDAYLLTEARRATLEPDFKFDNGYFDFLMSLKARAYDKSLFTLPLLYSASRREQFESALTDSAHPVYKQMVLSEAALVLPVDVLKTYSPGAAFSRYISLRQYDDARRVLDAAIEKHPEIGEPLQDILTAKIPASAAMPLAALRMKCVSHNLSDFCVAGENHSYRSHTHRNWSGARDHLGVELLDWLGCRGNFHNSLKGSEQLKSHGTMRWRYGKNSKPVPCAGGRTSPETSPLEVALLGLSSDVNFDNLKLFNDERRLTRALSQDIISWAKTAPQGRFARKPHAELMAEGLYRVIFMNRHEGAGQIDGMPAAERAFKLLHTRFRKTEWAGKSKYWWMPRRPHAEYSTFGRVWWPSYEAEALKHVH